MATVLCSTYRHEGIIRHIKEISFLPDKNLHAFLMLQYCGNERCTQLAKDILRRDFVLSGVGRPRYNTTALVRKYLELFLSLQISTEDALGLHWFLGGVGSEKNSFSTKHAVILAWRLRRDYITLVLQTSLSTTTRAPNYRLCVKPHCLRDPAWCFSSYVPQFQINAVQKTFFVPSSVI